MYSVKNNNGSETYTYIAIPLPVVPQTEQQQQNVYVEQNVILKTLSNGATYVIDTNHFLNSQNTVQLVHNNQLSQGNIIVQTDANASYNSFQLAPASNEVKPVASVVRKPGRPRKTDENSAANQNAEPKTKMYCCDVCLLSFNLLSNYNLHKSTHDKSNSKCPECNKSFARLASLKAHVVLHMKEETVTCEKCEKEFETELELKNHMKKHASDANRLSNSDMICRFCQMEFADSAEYKKHVAQHNKLRNVMNPSRHPRKPKKSDRVLKHQCKVCKKSFQKLSQIERHMRTHSGEKPFQCTECTKSFTQKCSLQIHMARHTGDKPYKCTLCPATCSQRGNLRAHVLKTHSVANPGENVFRCNKCSCVFKKLGTLNGHITKHHPDQTIVTGDIESVMTQLKELQKEAGIDKDILQQAISNSGLPAAAAAIGKGENSAEKAATDSVATFVTLADTNQDGNIKRYVVKQRKVGDIRWHMCMYCVKEFKKPSDLVRHLRVHTRERPYKCKQCFRSFAVKSTLTTHVKTHIGAKEYKCVMCAKVFSTMRTLNVHMRSHNVYKPYSCTLCQKQFLKSALLKLHMQSHMIVDDKDATGVESDIIDIVNEHNQSNRFELMEQPVIVTTKGLMSVGVPVKKRPIFEYLSKSRPHKCFKCPAAYRKLSHLKHHMATHSLVRKFKCDVCSKPFKSQNVLKTHQRIHEDENTRAAYMCLECKKNFSSVATLKRHMLTHNAHSPFLCPFCYKCFKTILMCRKHIKNCAHRSDAAADMAEFDMEKQTLRDAENEQVAQLTAAAALHYQPDLMDTISDETFGIHDVDNLQQTTDANSGLVHHHGNILIANSDLGVGNGGRIVLDANSANVQAQEEEDNDKMLQMEQTINDQLFMDNLSAVNEMMEDAAKGGGMSCTTDELVSTLEGTGQAADSDDATGADKLHFGSGYPTHIYVDLQPNDATCQLLDANFDGNLLKFQHDPMLLEDVNAALATQDNGGGLPNLGNDIHQQLIIMPQDIVDAPMSLQTETPQFALDPSLTLIPSSVSGLSQGIAAGSSGADMSGGYDMDATDTATLQAVTASALQDASTLLQRTGQRTTNNGQCSSASSMLMCSLCKTDFKSSNALKSHQCFNISVTSLNDIKNGIAVGNALMNANADKSGVQADDWINPELLLNRVQPDKNLDDMAATIPSLTAADSSAASTGSGSRGGGKQQCPYCPKSFKKPSDLQRHIRTHTGEKPFVCSECGKGFSLKSTLDSHVKLHKGRKDVVCTVCDHLFTTKGSLKVHMRLHTGAKPYKCNYCNEHFRTPGHRKTHTMSHFRDACLTGKHPKDVVPKQSKLKSLMAAAEKIELTLPQEVTEISEEPSMPNQEQIDPIIDHFLLENNITDLSNTYLTFDLVTKDDMNATSGGGTSSLVGDAHNKILTTTTTTTTHTIPITDLLDEKDQRDLEAALQQQLNNKAIAAEQQQQLQQLLQQQPQQQQLVFPYVFPCHVCGKSFKTKGVLQRHKRLHFPEKPLRCDDCNKVFHDRESYDVHAAIHAGQRPFKCDYCSNSFFTRGHLKTHLKRIHSIICANEMSAQDLINSGVSVIDGSLL